ncbi:MAG: hypothetical protein WC876_01950 [Candidatus Thermoplasmatota archaeon]|jgi:hypothetical protein
MATQTAATFARLQDQTWGLRVNGPRPTPGATVAVAKRDGSTKVVAIAAVLWHGTAKDGQVASLCSIAEDSTRREPLSVDGRPAERGQHWSSRGHGPTVRLCAGGCGRRVSGRYAECYSCHQESIDAM